MSADVCDAAWAASGAMWLTGDADGPPLLAPRALMRQAVHWQQRLAEASAAVGDAMHVDAPALLGERAALIGAVRRGDVSCGGATRLVPTRDAWLAVSLARPTDVELLPAWLGIDDVEELAAGVSSSSAAELVERGVLLGLPCALLGEVGREERPVRVEQLAGGARRTSMEGALVLDLSSLWAGPLCAQLLGLVGARVVKVESTARPDGARLGHRSFFDLLHAGHESVALDFADDADLALLRALVQRADVVIEASRPRALIQLGFDADATARAHGAQVWLSITGYGCDGENAMRVGFGDDAAVAGGLVACGDRGPVFCGDAIADPLAGLAAAVVVLESYAQGGSWMVDVALARVAAACSADSPSAHDGWSGPVAQPRARPATRGAAESGRDTAQLRRELGP